jgi:uncharacterized protein YybS (DUF2232 family)
MTASSLPAGERSELRSGPGALVAGFASALMFAGALGLPLLAPLSVLAPFPLILQRLHRGALSAAGAAFVATLLVGAAASEGLAIAFALTLAVPGLLIGDTLARGRGLVRGCQRAFGWLALQIGLALVFAGPRMVQELLAPIDEFRSEAFLDRLRASGLAAEQIEALGEQFAALKTALEVVYPAVFLIVAALLVLVNAALVRAYLLRRDPGWLEGGEFEGLRWGVGMAAAFVASGLLVALPATRGVGYNSLLLVAFFFALQGLAVVSFYGQRLAGPPLLRAALVVLVLVNPWAPQLLALVGLFDTWLDFRKWAEPPAGEPD